jgi:hypothetical protein
MEFFGPALNPTGRAAEWRVTVSSSSDFYALRARRPEDAELRPFFALDQRMISMPAWSAGPALMVDDAQRSCVLVVGPSQVELVGDPRSRRWRFTLVLILYELVATRLRRTQLELHAAAVEAAGRAIVIVGPKGAGKTTLSLHLLRAGLCRPVANDRVFAGADAGGFTARGIPTPVKIRPLTLAGLPELHRGLPWIERPYLYSVDELGRGAGTGTPDGAELALTPAQLAHRLGVEPVGSAPMGALVFPEVRTAAKGWTVERLRREEVREGIWANLYAGTPRSRASTFFEDLDGGQSLPSGSLADGLAEAFLGYRIVLGRGAYDDPNFAGDVLESLGAP